MSRKTLKMLLVAIMASFAIASMAEAAPKKAVRHRVKHSSRVSSGAAPTTVDQSTSKKRATASKKKRRAQAGKATAKNRQPGRRPRTANRSPSRADRRRAA